MDASTKRTDISSAFNVKKVDHGITFNLKQEQISAAEALLKGKNCICFLPTGFGKTLCFVINTLIADRPSITLIISPLLSLMENQMQTLTGWKLSCVQIGSDTSYQQTEGIANGDYSFVFASPESILKPKWRSIFMSNIWQQRLACIVFDEAHCISEWGEDFRPEYREMAQLRSFFKAPVLALTATSTKEVKSDIMSVLQLHESDTDIVSLSANRPNIFLQLQRKKSSDYEEELKWLIDYLKANGKLAKKIIIYCRSIDTVSEIFITIKDALGKGAYVDQIEMSTNLIIEMYHKCTHESSKYRILDEFSKTDSNIRCVVATVALGMGLDIKDIDMILHIGCPKSVISYWQEAGRCARDGRQGLSLIMYDNVTASLKSTDKSMSKIVKNNDNQCIRQMILDYFTVSEKQELKHKKCQGCQTPVCKCDYCTCCSVCTSKCSCSDDNYIFFETFLSQQI